MGRSHKLKLNSSRLAVTLLEKISIWKLPTPTLLLLLDLPELPNSKLVSGGDGFSASQMID